MAKRFRKQIGRALKRRFQQYENSIKDCSLSITTGCRDTLTGSYNQLVDKLRTYFVRYVVFVCVLLLVVVALALTSCNVTRTVTTQSQYFQKGDTTCTIITKTVESYDATKKTN